MTDQANDRWDDQGGAARDRDHLARGARDRRSPARRDRDRVLYTAEFRRLSRVTQTASATEQLLVHNRSTHSSRVEQVATALVTHHDNDPEAEFLLGQESEWRAAAAGLAHDLGHPPFGHAGEETLNDLLVCAEHRRVPTGSGFTPLAKDQRSRSEAPCSDCLLEDGFEGNAQTFRILTKLTVRGFPRGTTPDPDGGTYRTGLNLTRGTLAACTKYPWLRGDNPLKPKKWGAYDCDAQHLAYALGSTNRTSDRDVLSRADGSTIGRSTEAEVMDWADDITYAVHDIDDFFRLGLIPLDRLRTTTTEQRDFLEYATPLAQDIIPASGTPREFTEYVQSVFNNFPDRPFAPLPTELAGLQALVSDLIEIFVNATSITDQRRQGDYVTIAPRARFLNEIMKQLTWYYVIDNPALATMQQGQSKVLTELFESMLRRAGDYYLREPRNRSLQRRLPEELRFYVELCMNDPEAQAAYGSPSKLVARGVTDFIASLTDLGAYRLHARMMGDADVSILDASVAY